MSREHANEYERKGFNINVHCKCSSGHRHSSQHSRPKTAPETKKSFRSIRLSETIGHAAEFLLGAEPVALHFALDHVEGVTGQPESLSRQAAIRGDLVMGDSVPGDIIASGVLVHEKLECEEPDAVGLDFTKHSDYLTAEETAEHALVSRELADAIDRPIV